MIEDDVLARLAADQERSHQRVRALLADNPGALATYDASMEHVRSGGSEIESLWHSISSAQRRVVTAIGAGDYLVRSEGGFSRYDLVGRAERQKRAIDARTVAALIRHRLLKPAGATDDQAQIVIGSERLHQVLAYRRARH